jgi:hypothetical protein
VIPPYAEFRQTRPTTPAVSTYRSICTSTERDEGTVPPRIAPRKATAIGLAALGARVGSTGRDPARAEAAAAQEPMASDV